jgi:cellulose synthase/poly-beta-1,6-N-acetylglucosamine synthase-like glycosyltransferase
MGLPTTIWICIAAIAAILALPGTIELLLLTFSAVFLPRPKTGIIAAKSMRVGIVVPAHNEAANIAACVGSLRAADHKNFCVEILVVADNCDDKTAQIAGDSGARVLVRKNADLRGKGYALDFAFQTLLGEGCEALLVVDADTQVAPNFIVESAGQLLAGADAVQSRYVVKNPEASIRTRLMKVAFLAFNVLRPRGRDRMGLSCGIYGNGFGMRAETLRAVPYLSAGLVEDLEYHFCLLRAGKRVRFVDRATVSSDMPTSGKGVETQRARWEGGRIAVFRKEAAPLLGSLMRGDVRAIEPMLDLLLLPLAFHVTFLLVAASAPWMPVRIAGLSGLAVVVFYLMAALAIGGGTWRDVVSLLAAPFYVVWKLIMLPVVVRSSRGGSGWVRTERAGESKPD